MELLALELEILSVNYLRCIARPLGNPESPDWPEAAAWPEQAGGRAWQEAAAVAETNPDSRQVPIFEGQREAVWLGALGVPPQVVSYVFTTHQVCRPSVAAADFYEGYSGCR